MSNKDIFFFLRMYPLSLLLLLIFTGCACGSPVLEQVYRDVASVVSPGKQHLSREALRSLFNTLQKRVQCSEVSCGKCNPTEAIHQLITNHSVQQQDDSGHSGHITVSEFSVVVSGGILYLTSPVLVCTAIKRGTWREQTEHFLHMITHSEHHLDDTQHHQQNESIDIHGLELLLQSLSGHYRPLESEGCVGASDILREVSGLSGHEEKDVGAVLGHVLYHALKGHCFVTPSLPEESFFLDYIMEHLGSENFTVGELKSLMKSLKLGLDSEKDLEHDHADHNDQHQEDGHFNHDHADKRRKRSIHEHTEEHGTNTTWEQRCFSAEELMQIYGLSNNSSSDLGRSNLARLSPALVQQILSGACTEVTEPLNPDILSKTERYLYATLANVVITLLSMFGIVVLLCTSCTTIFQLCIQFCISLAVGSLTGDALLHLLPMFLGLHVHEEKNSKYHRHVHSEDGPPDYVYKMLVVMAGIYYFYLMETLFSLVTYKDKQHQHHHHHEDESEPHHCDHGRVLEMYQQEKKQEKSQSVSKADLVGCEDNEKPVKEYTREQRLLPYMITIGDSIHNFADGLAMGAAFSMSWKSGLATSIAVLCHELPHELGDFAILLHSGVSVRRALLLNVGSAMTSFFGLYIALSVATDVVTQQWIAAVTAGLFLYVGLADMLPTLVHIDHRRPWMMFLLQNVGLLSGWAILLVLSLFEDKINF